MRYKSEHAHNFKDLTGQRFGRYLVIEYAESKRWKVRCDCGVEKTTLSSNLLSGQSKSCGCYAKDHARELFTAPYDTSSKTYRIWAGIFQRIRNPKRNKNWGARGITICKRWHSFENFLTDMGDCPEGRSIERRDNGGNYEPNNCYWATKQEQNRNKRSNVWLEYGGRRMLLLDWSKESGIGYRTLFWRLKYAKWPLERILAPLRGNKSNDGPHDAAPQLTEATEFVVEV